MGDDVFCILHGQPLLLTAHLERGTALFESAERFVETGHGDVPCLSLAVDASGMQGGECQLTAAYELQFPVDLLRVHPLAVGVNHRAPSVVAAYQLDKFCVECLFHLSLRLSHEVTEEFCFLTGIEHTAVACLFLQLITQFHAHRDHALVKRDIERGDFAVIVAHGIELVHVAERGVGVCAGTLSHNRGGGWLHMVENNHVDVLVLYKVEELVYGHRLWQLELQDSGVAIVFRSLIEIAAQEIELAGDVCQEMVYIVLVHSSGCCFCFIRKKGMS